MRPVKVLALAHAAGSPTASQAAFPLTAGGRVPLAGGSGLQYSSMARVSIEKLTQWKPVHTMQKSLRMNWARVRVGVGVLARKP